MPCAINISTQLSRLVEGALALHVLHVRIRLRFEEELEDFEVPIPADAVQRGRGGCVGLLAAPKHTIVV